MVCIGGGFELSNNLMNGEFFIYWVNNKSYFIIFGYFCGWVGAFEGRGSGLSADDFSRGLTIA